MRSTGSLFTSSAMDSASAQGDSTQPARPSAADSQPPPSPVPAAADDADEDGIVDANVDDVDVLDDDLDADDAMDADADVDDDPEDDDDDADDVTDGSPHRPPADDATDDIVDVTDSLDSMNLGDADDRLHPAASFDVLITPSDDSAPPTSLPRQRLSMSIASGTPSSSPPTSHSPTSAISLLTTEGSSGDTPITPRAEPIREHGRSASLGAAFPPPPRPSVAPPLMVMRREGSGSSSSSSSPFLMVPELDKIPYMDPSVPPPSNSPPPSSPFLSPPSPHHHRRYHHHHLSNSPPRRKKAKGAAAQQPPSPPSPPSHRHSDAEPPSSSSSSTSSSSARLRVHTIETTHVSTYFNEQGQKQINQYVVEGGELGRGTSGEVKLVFSLSDQQYYAMKEVSKATAKTRRLRTKDQQDAWENLKREIAIMKKVDHPHVVRLIEVMDDPHKSAHPATAPPALRPAHRKHAAAGIPLICRLRCLLFVRVYLAAVLC